MFFSKGPPGYHGAGSVSRVSDRTRLFGPGLTLLGVSAIAAAVIAPFVPIHPQSGDWDKWHETTLPWRIVGYGMGIGAILAMIAVMGRCGSGEW